MCVMNSLEGPIPSPSLSESTWSPPGGAGLILPVLLPPSAAKALQSSAILAERRCHHASFCLLLAEGMVAESWHRAAAEFSGWQWGEKAEHGPEPRAYCCLQSWKSQSSRDHTLHMKVHFHQLQLSLHLFSSPGRGLSRWEPSLLPEPCLATPRPAFQALPHLHSSPSLGA